MNEGEEFKRDEELVYIIFPFLRKQPMTQQEKQFLKAFLETQVKRDWVAGELAAGADLDIMALLLAEIFIKVYLPSAMPMEQEREDGLRTPSRQLIRQWLEEVAQALKRPKEAEKIKFLSQFKTIPPDKVEQLKDDFVRQFKNAKSARERAIIRLKFKEVVGRDMTHADLRPNKGRKDK